MSIEQLSVIEPPAFMNSSRLVKAGLSSKEHTRSTFGGQIISGAIVSFTAIN